MESHKNFSASMRSFEPVSWRKHTHSRIMKIIANGRPWRRSEKRRFSVASTSERTLMRQSPKATLASRRPRSDVLRTHGVKTGRARLFIARRALRHITKSVCTRFRAWEREREREREGGGGASGCRWEHRRARDIRYNPLSSSLIMAR